MATREPGGQQKASRKTDETDEAAAQAEVSEDLFDKAWQITLGIFQSYGLHGKLRDLSAEQFTTWFV